MTFAVFVAQWWPRYSAGGGRRGVNAPTTLQEKEAHLRLHILPMFARVPLAGIDNRALTEWVGRLRAKGLSEKSVRNVVTTLKTILSSAVDWGDLGALPRFPAIVVPETEWDFYRKDEVAALLPHDEGAALLFALHTGARQGEQIALLWSDVDFARGTVQIRRSAPRGGAVGPTKSKRFRTVPLTEALAKALRSLERSSVRVFPDATPDRLTALLERAAKAAGLRVLRWHDLRHTYASLLAMDGVPLRRIQKLLGHASIVTTERYAHLAPEERHDEVLAALG